MTLFTIIHFNTTNIDTHNKQLDNFVSLTKLPSIVKSVSYFEPRYIEYDDFSYILYPELNNPSYMEFVYE